MGCSSSRDTAAIETDIDTTRPAIHHRYNLEDRHVRARSRRAPPPTLIESLTLALAAEEPPLRDVLLTRRPSRWSPRRGGGAADEERLVEILALQQSLAAMEEFFESLMGHAQRYMEAMDPAAAAGGGPPPASQAILDSLSRSPLKREELDRDGQNKTCGICCEAHVVGATVTRLPCGHFYCPNCVEPWLQRHCTCPTCRYELATDDPDYETGRLERMRLRKIRITPEQQDEITLTATADEEDDASSFSLEESLASSSSPTPFSNSRRQGPSHAWDEPAALTGHGWERFNWDQRFVLEDSSDGPVLDSGNETSVDLASLEENESEDEWMPFGEPSRSEAQQPATTSSESTLDRRESISLGDCCSARREMKRSDADDDSSVSID